MLLTSQINRLLRKESVVHNDYVLLLLVNEKAVWPIPRKNKVKWDNQTESGMKKGGIRRDSKELPKKQDART